MSALVDALIAAAAAGEDWHAAQVAAERELMSRLALELDGPAPEPFYQRGRVRLYCGPAEEIAPRLRRPRQSVSWSDPPYSAHVHDSARSNARKDPLHNGNGVIHKSAERRKMELHFDHLTPSLRRLLAAHAARLATRWVGFFCDVEGVDAWRVSQAAAGLEYVRSIYWRKVGGAPQITGDRPAVSREAIVLAHHPGRKRWNGGGHQFEFQAWEDPPQPIVHDVPIALNRGGRDERKHTTKKPIALMDRIMRDFGDHSTAHTNEPEVWIDLTAGEGTTLQAAACAGFGAWGIELDPKWAQAAADRIDRALDAAEKSQTPMRFIPKAKAPKQAPMSFAPVAQEVDRED